MIVAHRVTVLKVAQTTASKAAKMRPVLKTVAAVATLSHVAMSHVVKNHAANLAKAVVHLAATLVPHVVSKIAPHAALKTVRPHAAHVRRLKPAARHLTSQAVQPVASRLVAVLTLKNAHPSHAWLVN
jgi:hypothetical protein